MHPTFNPIHVQTTFRGREASLTVRAWGGFTVGAWLPDHQIELECDLAGLPDAPQIIREAVAHSDGKLSMKSIFEIERRFAFELIQTFPVPS